MRAPTKWLACAAGLAALAPWLPGWAAAAGLDVWNFPGEAARHRESRRFGRELDRVSSEMVQMLAAKEAILDDLRAGRISFTAATDVYYQMVIACPNTLENLRWQFPEAGSDLERTALRLMVHGGTLTAAGTGSDELGERLVAEYRRRFPAGCLPPPGPLPAGGG